MVQAELGKTGAQVLGLYFQLLSQAHWQGTRSEVDEPRLDLVVIRDASDAGGSLTHSTTTQAQLLPFCHIFLIPNLKSFCQIDYMLVKKIFTNHIHEISQKQKLNLTVIKDWVPIFSTSINDEGKVWFNTLCCICSATHLDRNLVLTLFSKLPKMFFSENW